MYQFRTRKAITRAADKKKGGHGDKTPLRTVLEEFNGAVKRLDFTMGTVDDEDLQLFYELNENNQKARWKLTHCNCVTIVHALAWRGTNRY